MADLPAVQDLNLIENLWSVIKQDVYADAGQFTLTDVLWLTAQPVAEAVQSAAIKESTDSMTDRVLEVIRRNGTHMAK